MIFYSMSENVRFNSSFGVLFVCVLSASFRILFCKFWFDMHRCVNYTFLLWKATQPTPQQSPWCLWFWSNSYFLICLWEPRYLGELHNVRELRVAYRYNCPKWTEISILFDLIYGFSSSTIMLIFSMSIISLLDLALLTYWSAVNKSAPWWYPVGFSGTSFSFITVRTTWFTEYLSDF